MILLAIGLLNGQVLAGLLAFTRVFAAAYPFFLLTTNPGSNHLYFFWPIGALFTLAMWLLLGVPFSSWAQKRALWPAAFAASILVLAVWGTTFMVLTVSGAPVWTVRFKGF